MDTNKVDMFIASISGKIPPEKIYSLRSHLETVEESRFAILYSLPFRDPTMMLIISLLVGSLGIDRMMIGQVGLGVIKLLTCGGFVIWALIDLFLIMGATKEYNFDLIRKNV